MVAGLRATAKVGGITTGAYGVRASSRPYLRGPHRSNAVRLPDQDHRTIKRVIRPILNFKSFQAARSILAGIELMHMIRKGQLNMERGDTMSFADQFYALAGQLRPA